jgi:thiol-disulfide isomerase/thioredoxin
LGVVQIAGSPNVVWPANEISPVKETVTLKNGTTVAADGTITKKDGQKITLQENEFLSTDGSRQVVDISIYKLMESTDGNSTDPGNNAAHGDYKDYSESTVQNEQKAGHKVVLFFHAQWCPFCKAANTAFINKRSQIPVGVTVLKTDYDENVDLKTKYGVTYQHTFVQIDNDGTLVSKWSGGDIENLKKYLK